MQNKNKKGILAYAVATLATLLSLFLGFSGWRLAAAEYYYSQALREAAANRGAPTFELLEKTIKLNKYDLRYNLTSAQIALSIANNLASRGKKLTEEEHKTIQRLVQHAIHSAKNAVALNRSRADSWTNLANIYRNLINVAQDADQWAISSYQQAIVLNPNDPQLRIAYGQLLYSLNRLEEAQRQFEVATALKPDFANAHYNLAVVAKQQKKFELAKTEFVRTLSALQPDSADVSKVQKELDAVNAQLKKQTKAGQNKVPKQNVTPATSRLQGPAEASPAAKLEPRINLSEKEAAPELTPSFSASSTPTLSLP